MNWRSLPLACIAALSAIPNDLLAQDPGDLTVQSVEARIQTAGSLPGLDEAQKERLKLLYEEALEFVKAATASREVVTRYLADVAAVPQKLEAVKATLATEPADRGEVPTATSADLPELERRLQAARAASEQAASSVRANEAERQRRSLRSKDLPKLITDMRDERSRLDASELPSAADDPPAILDARALKRRARSFALEQSIAGLEAEKRLYEAEADLLVARGELAERDAALAASRLEELDGVVQAKRASEAVADAVDAAKTAQDVPSALTSIAQTNQKLAEDRAELAGDLAATASELDDVTTLRKELENRFADIKKRIEVAGLTDAIGLQLRQEKSKLPSERFYAARIEARRTTITDAQLRQFDLEQQVDTLEREGAKWLQAAISGIAPAPKPDQLEAIRKQGEALLRTQREYLDDLWRDGEAYISKLVALDTEEQLLITKARESETFVNQRVLWIRSARPIWGTDRDALVESIGWFGRADEWADVGTALGKAFRRGPVVFVLGILTALAALFGRRRAVRKISARPRQAPRRRDSRRRSGPSC